jgi:hypothetical protein
VLGTPRRLTLRDLGQLSDLYGHHPWWSRVFPTSRADISPTRGDILDKGRPWKESELLAAVILVLQTGGWLVYHTHQAEHSPSGFPDITATRGGHVLFVELKTDTGLPSEQQLVWLDRLSQANVSVRLWRPDDYFGGQVDAWLY